MPAVIVDRPSPIDRVALRTAAALLAKADRSEHDPESRAFAEGTYRLLGRVLTGAQPAAGASRVAAAYRPAPAGPTVDLTL